MSGTITQWDVLAAFHELAAVKTDQKVELSPLGTHPMLTPDERKATQVMHRLQCLLPWIFNGGEITVEYRPEGKSHELQIPNALPGSDTTFLATPVDSDELGLLFTVKPDE